MKTQCRACFSEETRKIFEAPILGRRVEYFECPQCKYVQVESPTWLEEAYASVINDSDTGLMQRNLNNVGMVIAAMASIGKVDGRVVDCAGGYGILTRLLRDKGIDALWSDPYCKNLAAIGFEHAGEQAVLATAFEAFEHFVCPNDELEHLLQTAPNLLISTEIIPTPAPEPDRWWYYGLSHGQHVGFMRVATLENLAQKFGKFLITDGRSYHFFTENEISRSKWRAYSKIAKRMPWVFTRNLKPKTWDDHVALSG